MAKRHLGGLTPYVLTASTDASGNATFTIPAGRFTRWEGCFPVVVSGAVAGRFCPQIASEPAVGANLSTAAGTVVVAVNVSASTNVTLLGATVVGMVAAGANVTVRLLAWGE